MQPPSNYPPPLSPAPPTYSTMQVPPQRSKGCGCFGTGCLIFLGVLLLLGIIVGIGGYFVAKQFRENLTADHPVDVPVSQATDAQYAEVSARIRRFQKEFEAGQRAALELTANDLNTMVAKDPDLRGLRGKLFFTIERNLLGLEGSFPLGDMPVVGTLFRGRYFNGKASGELTIYRAALKFTAHTLEANGKRVGPDAMKGLTARFNETFQDEIRRRRAAAEVIDGIETLDIDDGKIRIVSRSREAPKN